MRMALPTPRNAYKHNANNDLLFFARRSFDWDTNKSYRKSTPWFYGYIPSSLKERIVVFMSLLYLSAFNLFARSLACVLLHVKGGFTCVALMLGLELLLYLIVKLLQRDFVYWMPVYGVWMLISSLTIRSIVKVVTGEIGVEKKFGHCTCATKI